jgi:hypothetical protein
MDPQSLFPIEHRSVEVRQDLVAVRARHAAVAVRRDLINMGVKNVTITGSQGAAAYASGGASLSIRDSPFQRNGYGVYAIGAGGLPGTILVERSDISFNTSGVYADGSSGGALVRYSDCVVTGNSTGLQTLNGGQIISFRTNMLAGNTTDGSTPFSISLK